MSKFREYLGTEEINEGSGKVGTENTKVNATLSEIKSIVKELVKLSKSDKDSADPDKYYGMKLGNINSALNSVMDTIEAAGRK